jgi:hypothetical protein
MTTLHIEHPVTDFGAWKAAFDRFAEAREKSGVRSHRILRPVDNTRPGYSLNRSAQLRSLPGKVRSGAS